MARRRKGHSPGTGEWWTHIFPFARIRVLAHTAAVGWGPAGAERLVAGPPGAVITIVPATKSTKQSCKNRTNGQTPNFLTDAEILSAKNAKEKPNENLCSAKIKTNSSEKLSPALREAQIVV